MPGQRLVTPKTDRPRPDVESFLSGKSEKTIKAYRQDLEDFRSFVGVGSLDEAANVLLSRGHGEANGLVRAYRADLLESGLQPSTVNRRLAALRSLVSLARTLGMVPWTLAVKNVKAEAYGDTSGPGIPAVKRILKTLEARMDAKGKRDSAIIRLMFDLALRSGEVTSLDLGDVDLERGRLAIRGKGRTQKTFVSMPEPTREALQEWIEVRGEEPGALFINFNRSGNRGGRITGTGLYLLVRKLGRDIGVTVCPHGFRHSSITEACKTAQAAGYGLEEVMAFSRHKDGCRLMSLLIYSDADRNIQGGLAGMVARAV